MKDNSQYGKAELLAAFIEKRLTDNLAAFKEFDSSVYERFRHYEEQQLFLVYDEAGNVNVFDKDSESFLYSGDPVQSVLANYTAFITKPIYIPFKTAKDIKSLRNDRYIHSEFLDELCDVQEKLDASFGRDFFESYLDQGEDGNQAVRVSDINTLIAISSGPGFDLEKFVSDHAVNNLFLLEPSDDAFYISLQLTDWAAIIDNISSRGGLLSILFSHDYEQLVNKLINSIENVGKYNMACSYIYSAFHQEGQEFLSTKVIELLRNRVLKAFGFFDDAKISTAHTVENFRRKVPCLKADENYPKNWGQEDYPVYILGNGPSLDKDIEFVKSKQDRVVVISCGTALRALYLNGIKPDIHVELERTAHIPYWIKNSAPDDSFFHYLKDIRLIAISHVHPDVFELFGESYMMLKSFEAGSELIKSALPGVRIPLVEGTGGSCVHAAYTISILLGFRELYLFGVDMGYKELDYHHSKYSLYNNLNDKSKEYYKPEKETLVKYPANFGNGFVMSGGNLPMFKSALELNIEFWNKMVPGINVYNCSDGVRIEGAKSFDVYNEAFKSDLFDKDVLLKNVCCNFFTYKASDKNIKSIDKKIKQGVVNGRVATRVLKSILRPVSTVREGRELVDGMFSGFIYFADEHYFHKGNEWMNEFYRGSLLSALSILNTMLYSPYAENLRLEAFNATLPCFELFFTNVINCLENDLTTLDSEAFYNMVD